MSAGFSFLHLLQTHSSFGSRKKNKLHLTLNTDKQQSTPTVSLRGTGRVTMVSFTTQYHEILTQMSQSP